MFKFEHPDHLWLIAAVPLLGFLRVAWWLWRRKALARLVPLAQSAASGSSDGLIFKLAELAEPMGVLTNEQIDELVYGC